MSTSGKLYVRAPYRETPLLRYSYSLIAPLCDLVIERPMRETPEPREAMLRLLTPSASRP